ncbi:unnamed protein product, partial [Oikopleura dioica]
SFDLQKAPKIQFLLPTKLQAEQACLLACNLENCQKISKSALPVDKVLPKARNRRRRVKLRKQLARSRLAKLDHVIDVRSNDQLAYRQIADKEMIQNEFVANKPKADLKKK